MSPSALTYDKSSARPVAGESIRALEASIRDELGPREPLPALDEGDREVDEDASGGFADLLLGTLSTSLGAPSAVAPLPSPARVSALRRDADSAVRASPVCQSQPRRRQRQRPAIVRVLTLSILTAWPRRLVRSRRRTRRRRGR